MQPKQQNRPVDKCLTSFYILLLCASGRGQIGTQGGKQEEKAGTNDTTSQSQQTDINEGRRCK